MGTVGEQDLPLFLLTYTGWFPLLTIISFKEGFLIVVVVITKDNIYLAEGRFKSSEPPFII